MSCREEKGRAEVAAAVADLQNMEFSLVPRLKSSLVHIWSICQLTLNDQCKKAMAQAL